MDRASHDLTRERAKDYGSKDYEPIGEDRWHHSGLTCNLWLNLRGGTIWRRIKSLQ